LGTDLAPNNLLATVKARPDDFPMITDADIETLERFAVTGTGGGHADFGETALIYGTYPELVAPDRFDAESGISNHRADYLTAADVKYGRAWPSNFPNAYSGFPPFGCSPTIGQAAVKISVERLVKIFDMLRNDEDCVRML